MQMQNPQEAQDNLPALDSKEQTRSYTYYKALKDLKQVNEQIVVFTNRLKLLSQKEQHAKNPVSDFYERKEERLRAMNRQYRQKSQQALLRVKNKSQTQLALRKVRNEMTKQQHQRRIERSKRIVSEERFNRHDKMRQISQQNKIVIERIRMRSLMERQERHNTMFEQQRRIRTYLRYKQESRIDNIKEESQKQTDRILKKMREKEKELVQIKNECENHEQRLKLVMRRKDKKMKKKQYSHKPFTVQATKSSIFDQESISTPRSAIHFVVIS